MQVLVALAQLVGLLVFAGAGVFAIGLLKARNGPHPVRDRPAARAARLRWFRHPSDQTETDNSASAGSDEREK